MLSAARSQSLSVLTTCAGDLKPSGNSTVIGPAASRITCQLLTTRPKSPRTSTSVPVPYEMPSFSTTVTRATAGSGAEEAGASGQEPGARGRPSDGGITGWFAATVSWLLEPEP